MYLILFTGLKSRGITILEISKIAKKAKVNALAFFLFINTASKIIFSNQQKYSSGPKI